MSRHIVQIVPVEDGLSETLWLRIEDPDIAPNESSVIESERADFWNDHGGFDLPILPDEVASIRDACNRWLASTTNQGTDEELESQLDHILDIETITCGYARNPSGKPAGKHYSDFDLSMVKSQLKALVKRHQEAQ